MIKVRGLTKQAAGRKAEESSLGMRQRLSLAHAMLGNLGSRDSRERCQN